MLLTNSSECGIIATLNDAQGLLLDQLEEIVATRRLAAARAQHQQRQLQQLQLHQHQRSLQIRFGEHQVRGQAFKMPAAR